MEKDNKKKPRYRHELKFMLTKTQFEELKSRLSSFLEVDKNTGEDGTYFIRSLYFDDYKNTSYFQVIDGISQREKYRIRYYNNNPDYICLEKKYKENNMTNKTSCRVTKELVQDLIDGKLDISKENHKLLNEFILKTKFFGYRPAVIIDYNRIPYTYVAGNVRITLDYNISMDYKVSEFFKNSNECNIVPLMEKDVCLLEVKYDDFIPSYITWLLDLNNLTRTSYSKYSSGRIQQIGIMDRGSFYEQY